MDRRPVKIKSVVSELIGKISSMKAAGLDDVLDAWHAAAGKKFSAKTRPANFEKKKLVINVCDPNWLYEISLQKEIILKKLQDKLGCDKINQLILRIGEVNGAK